MARKFIVALVLFALLGMAFAKAADAPSKEEEAAAPAPNNENVGNHDDDGASPAGSEGFAEAGPVGGPVPDGAFENGPTDSATEADGSPKKNGVSSLEGSAIVGVAATTAAFSMFYF